MKNLFVKIIFILSFVIIPSLSAKVESGKLAPNFSLVNEEGKNIELAKYLGKTVVLEWYNKDCPFVKKHYGSNNMQKLQAKWTQKDIVWLSIISSAKGKQGFMTNSEALVNKMASGSNATSILLDVEGKVGQIYGAKTTPHMYIINKKGQLLYQGAIDDNSSYDPAVIPNSKNHVDEILVKLDRGQAVKPGRTDSYGCGVKY